MVSFNPFEVLFMNVTMQLVLDLAESFHQQGIRRPVSVLADLLNAAGHRTVYGTPYKGKRGTYRLVSMTYRRLHGAGRTAQASMVAAAFTKPNGGYAY
jgi:hypothetical protein